MSWPREAVVGHYEPLPERQCRVRRPRSRVALRRLLRHGVDRQMATVAPSLRFGSYRCKPALDSFKTLWRLPPEKVEAFLDSYDIYDYDWADEAELIRDKGIDYYEEVKRKLVDYYSVLNHLCAIGEVEKMYIPPALDLSASILE